MIKLRKKRIAFIVFLLIFAFCSLAMGYSQDDRKDEEGANSHLLIIVQEGDTLWKIAREHQREGQDTRALIYGIRKINDLNTAQIYPGQQIKIPLQ